MVCPQAKRQDRGWLEGQPDWKLASSF